MKNRLSLFAPAFFFASLFILLSFYFYSISSIKYLDSVFLFESVNSILDNGVPTSKSLISLEKTFSLLQLSPEQYCADDLISTRNSPYNVIDNHAYIGLYPIAVLSLFTGSAELTFAMLNALVYVSLLLLPYLYLRAFGMPWLMRIGFLALVLIYPGWLYPQTWDYYMDKFYMPFLLALLYLLHVAKSKRFTNKDARITWGVGLFFVGFMASIMTERGALLVILSLAFYLIFFFKNFYQSKLYPYLLFLIGFSALYLGCYFLYFHKGISGGGGLISNMIVDFEVLKIRFSSDQFGAFVKSNFLVFGLPILFSGIPYILLSLSSLLPNVFITIGGAELNGWATHYHSSYIPFLIFSASIGYLNFFKALKLNKIKLIFLSLILIYSYLVSNLYDPFTGIWGRGVNFDILSNVKKYYLSGESSAEKIKANKIKGLEEVIPAGAVVSAPEGAFSALYKTRNISIFPVNIDRADYLVASGSSINGVLRDFGGAATHLSGDEALKLNECIHQRAKKQGFVLLKSIPEAGLLVFGRLEK